MTVSPRSLPRFALLLLLLLCSACVTRQPAPSSGPSSGGKAPAPTQSVDKAESLWQRYAVRAAAAEGMNGPFRVAANLRYSANSGESTRVSSLLWGNGKKDSPYPLRLDLTAGPGVVVAKIREDEKNFLAFAPDEKTAYTRNGDDKALESLGVPIPMSLGDLALLLTGRSGRLFLPSVISSDSGAPSERTLTATGASYRLSGVRLPGVLELSETGVPSTWREHQPNGWSMVFEPSEENPLRPRKIRVSHPKGHSALIVVREMSRVSPPYTASQLQLTLPPGTEKKVLE